MQLIWVHQFFNISMINMLSWFFFCFPCWTVKSPYSLLKHVCVDFIKVLSILIFLDWSSFNVGLLYTPRIILNKNKSQSSDHLCTCPLHSWWVKSWTAGLGNVGAKRVGMRIMSDVAGGVKKFDERVREDVTITEIYFLKHSNSYVIICLYIPCYFLNLLQMHILTLYPSRFRNQTRRRWKSWIMRKIFACRKVSLSRKNPNSLFLYRLLILFELVYPFCIQDGSFQIFCAS